MKDFRRVKSQESASDRSKGGLARREFRPPITIQNDALLNRPAVNVGLITIPAATVVQGPDVPIPDGFTVWIRAQSANAAEVRVAPNEKDAGTTNKVYPLQRGEGLALAVQNLNVLWFAGTAGDNVDYVVEADAENKR